jgi:RNA polymerase sigma factor (sigma-70 family)
MSLDDAVRERERPSLWRMARACAKGSSAAGHLRDVANPTEREEQFRQLFLAEYRHVLAYALRRTSNLAEAQDAVADSFTVAWRRLEDAPAGESARPWLYGIARHAIANQRRAQRRLLAVRERLRLQRPALPDVQTTAESRHEWQAVLAALARLAPNEQEILRLALWEDLLHREIGAVLGCSENAAGIRLHRARRRLTEELEKEDVSAGHSLVE